MKGIIIPILLEICISMKITIPNKNLYQEIFGNVVGNGNENGRTNSLSRTNHAIMINFRGENQNAIFDFCRF